MLLAIEQDATGQRRAVLLVSDRGPSLAASGGLHATYRLAAGQGPATPDDHDTHRWYVASVAVDHVQLKRVSPPTDTTSDTSLTLWLGPPPSGGAPVDATERAP